MLSSPVTHRFDVRRWLSAGAVFFLGLAAYLPVVDHDFINWDDPEYFLNNPHYRGLNTATLRWCFTTTHVGHYQPINWLTYAVDYQLGGLDPARYHLTQAFLHALAAVLVLSVSHRLLRLASPDWHSDLHWAAAIFAGLLFALHPLRVESVAWASARGDILATIFYLAAILAYIPAALSSHQRAMPGSRLLLVALLFTLAALSKEMAVTLPAVLIVLDVYPLRRLPGSPRRWLDTPHRPILLEKLPLLIISGAVIAGAFFAAGGDTVAGLREHPLSTRLAQLIVSIVHYPYRTLVPGSLSPLNEFPIGFGLTHRRVLISGLALLLTIIALMMARRKWPGLTDAVCCYVILILPVTGLTQRGPQMTADRYSYLSCIPFALIAGGLFARFLLRSRGLAILTAALILIALTVRTQSQLSRWRDSITLWNHALAVDPTSGGAHCNLAQALETAGHSDQAIEHYRRGLALGWRHPTVYRNLAAILQRTGRHTEAIEAYRADIQHYPGRWESYYYLAISYERMGDVQNAADAYRQALELRLDLPDAHVALARLFMLHGHDAEAVPRLLYALELDPRHPEALERLAILRAREGDYDAAVELMDRCIEAVSRRADPMVLDGLESRRAEYLKARDTSTGKQKP